MDNAEANARLIAAAPELLATLRVMVRYCGMDANESMDAGILDRARTALAKAVQS